MEHDASYKLLFSHARMVEDLLRGLVEMHTMLAERVVEWTQRWKEEGLQQGQVQEARAMVLEAVAVHFEEIPPDIAATVQGVEDRERLHGLLRQAITCPTLEAFREALHRQG